MGNAINIAQELRNAVKSALDSGGAFDLRCLSRETAQALGRVEYPVMRNAILAACSKDPQLWQRVQALLRNPLTEMAIDGGVRKMHNDLKRGG
jgi:hypothetical protein